MTEETAVAAEAPASEPQFSIQRIYLKDLSFETPQGPSAFTKQWQPKVNQDLSTKSAKIEEDVFEILSLEGSVAARNHLGGTAPAQVSAAAGRALARLAERN